MDAPRKNDELEDTTIPEKKLTQTEEFAGDSGRSKTWKDSYDDHRSLQEGHGQREGESQQDLERLADDLDRLRPVPSPITPGSTSPPLIADPIPQGSGQSQPDPGSRTAPSSALRLILSQGQQGGSSSASTPANPSKSVRRPHPLPPIPKYPLGFNPTASIPHIGTGGVQNTYFGGRPPAPHWQPPIQHTQGFGARYVSENSQAGSDTQEWYDSRLAVIPSGWDACDPGAQSLSASGRRPPSNRYSQGSHESRRQVEPSNAGAKQQRRQSVPTTSSSSASPRSASALSFSRAPRPFPGNTGFLINNNFENFRIGQVIEAAHMVPDFRAYDRPALFVTHPMVGNIRASWRKFVVVRIYEDSHMLCVPLVTYGGTGLSKRTASEADNFLAIFDELDVPNDAIQGEYLVVKEAPKWSSGDRVEQHVKQSAILPSSFVSLAKPHPIDFLFPIGHRGALTEQSLALLLSRYELLQAKGLQDPRSQRTWQQNKLSESALPQPDLRSTSSRRQF